MLAAHHCFARNARGWIAPRLRGGSVCQIIFCKNIIWKHYSCQFISSDLLPPPQAGEAKQGEMNSFASCVVFLDKHNLKMYIPLVLIDRRKYMRKITARFPGIKVLVVDDYEVNQQLTRELLLLMECDADIAESGAEAMKLCAVKDYDMIFMDVQMPGKDGYEVTQEIREQEKLKQRKSSVVIALTANALAGDKEKCISAGMNDYLSKPIRAENLEAIMKKYCPSQNPEI